MAAEHESDKPLISDAIYTHADTLVAIGAGRRLNLHCTGTGSPTVVFDAGLGDSTKAWGLVQPEVSNLTRACSYDRAGLGFSDPSERPGTSANAVDDLHLLLGVAGVKPPYVLVGHCYGGMNVKLFAETYREEVAGIVYVDPTHEDLGQRLWALEPGIDEKQGLDHDARELHHGNIAATRQARRAAHAVCLRRRPGLQLPDS